MNQPRKELELLFRVTLKIGVGGEKDDWFLVKSSPITDFPSPYASDKNTLALSFVMDFKFNHEANEQQHFTGGVKR
ncbi:hypothetical protein CEXT_705091 [Caerostris extrusa]|uniref:Uncharacterized protein n=1 Tax=Caerostris extrusa TaxID=172846 RepID=A0AAV4NZL9_CAEEX|nr:hypothetical protein CEXT_705091 [Caerostris extrusa]